MNRWFIVIAVCCIGFNSWAQEDSTDAFIIGVNSAYEDSENTEIIETLLHTLYAPLGITPKILFLPSKRGLQLANQFQIDAEAGRVLTVANEYENLVVVNEPMLDHPVYLFCLKKDNCKKDPALLYAVIGGFQAAYGYCDKYQLKCFYENSFSFMVKMLESGAADVLIGSKKLLTSNLCNSEVGTVFYRQEDDLKIISFHLVNSTHKDKVAKLETSIKSMHQNGHFDAFVQFNNQTPTHCATEFVALTE